MTDKTSEEKYSNQSDKVKKTATKRRIVSVDLLRGFLLTFMVADHFLLELGNSDAWGNPLLLFNDLGLGIWGASGFLMMMGMSLVFSNKRNDQRSFSELHEKALIRGAYIFLAGVLLSFITGGTERMWEWDILPLIGFATIVVFYIRKWPDWRILLLAALIIGITPWLRGLPFFDNITAVDFHEMEAMKKLLPGMIYEIDSESSLIFTNFEGALKGFIVGGYFGVFPWIALSLVGFFLGRRVVDGKFKKDIPWVFTFGIILMILSVSIVYMSKGNPTDQIASSYIVPFCIFPNTFSTIIYQIGITSAVLAVLYYIFDIKYKTTYHPGFIAKIFLRTSNYSLSFYFVHYLILDLPIIGLDYYFDIDIVQSLGTVSVIIAAIVALSILQIMVILFNKYNGKYSLEWLMSRIVNLFVKDYNRSLNEIK